jgi:hypothetical protein
LEEKNQVLVIEFRVISMKSRQVLASACFEPTLIYSGVFYDWKHYRFGVVPCFPKLFDDNRGMFISALSLFLMNNDPYR